MVLVKESAKENAMDIEELLQYLVTPTAQIALIIGLAELAKKIGLEPKFVPILDLFLGLVSGIGIYGLAFGRGIIQGILLGIFFGLSACGLFSGAKNVIEGIKPEEKEEEDSLIAAYLDTIENDDDPEEEPENDES